jgi:hypothetical protein
MELDLLNEFIQSRWSHKPILKSYRLIGKMIEVKFEDGFGEVIEVGKYYDWISENRSEKINNIIK